MQEYIDGPLINSSMTRYITDGILATFVFLSGYLLGKKEISSPQDILLFYKSRFIRIYPLFFLSATSYLLMSSMLEIGLMGGGIRQYMMTIAGLSIFAGPPPETLWFVGMLLFFYLWTPVILYKRLLLSKLFFLLPYTVCVLGWLDGWADRRAVIYFPMFYLGLLFANRHIVVRPLLIPTGVSIVVIAYLLLRTEYGSLLHSMVFDVAFIVAACLAGSLISYIPAVARMLKMISYASMTAYLVHRQVYIVLMLLFGKWTWPVAIAVIMPGLLLLSGEIQSLYDYIIPGLIVRHKTCRYRRSR